jgi:hypothetical protein
MRLKIKKYAAYILLIGIVSVVLFSIESRHPKSVKSYLLNETELLWGQAYSPNIGWINFYCDGAGNTQPAGVSPSKGAASMPDTCDDIAYGVSYSLGTFSGEAYSSNYGWLDMNGLSMQPNYKIQGTTDGSTLGNYNFDTTYFKKNQPNNNNPGVYYHNDLGHFCGFAYSDAVGYISFCDPQTKDKSPDNIPVPGFDWSTYAVYSGVGDDDDQLAPTLTTPAKVFATTDDYDLVLIFQDDISGIKSIEVNILDAGGDEQTYSSSGSSSVSIINHDFSRAGKYDLSFTVCDDNDNCTNPAGNGLESDFFHVVANIPVWSGCHASINYDSNCPSNIIAPVLGAVEVADGASSHTVIAKLVDMYGNQVVSESGIKDVKVKFNFTNATNLDQITGTGDSAKFTSAEFSFSQDGGASAGFFTEVVGGDGIFQIDVSSFAPTYAGDSDNIDSSIKLDFENIEYIVEAINGYLNVGADDSDPVSFSYPFAFSSTLTATPQALIWNGSSYTEDSAGIGNITINAPKRFGVDMLNNSVNASVSSPQIGIAITSGSSDVLWGDVSAEGIIEKISTEEDLSETLSLDVDGVDSFTKTFLADLDTGITDIAAGNSNTLRFHTTPVLSAGKSVLGALNTTLQTYLCYIFNKDIEDEERTVCHRSNKLASTDTKLQNPGIEIIGSVRSSGGTSSKQTGAALNKSLGDIALNEFKTGIAKNTTAFTKSFYGCTNASAMKITGSSGGDFTTDNISGCSYREDSVLFLKGDVMLEAISPAISITLPNKPKTLLIEGGDVYIKSNLQYSSNDSLLGVIVLKDSSGNGGNIFIDPSVTNAVGAFYAEGSLISVNAQTPPKCGEDTSSDCDGSLGFCDRSYELRNQLYWKGLIATQNTIGGSDSVPLGFPSAVPAGCPALSCTTTAGCTSENARIYDLAYLRTFHPDSDGNPADGITSSSAFIIQYDSRIQNSPPPLFEFSSGGESSEAGY